MVGALLLAGLLGAAPGAPGDVPPLVEAAAQSAASDTPVVFDGNELDAVAAIARWYSDPVSFVREVFGAEPDAWQADALAAIAHDPRVGMSACKGPGKSCVLAWVIWWFLATRYDAQIICTSITGDNLTDGLWKECAIWLSKSPYLQRVFDQRGERIIMRERPKTWWCSARQWAQSADATAQANTLAGFHGEHVMFVLDEMGDYPDGMLVAAEAIFSNEHLAEAKIVAAWNPTSTSGPAYRVCTKDRKRWTIVFISGDPDDPKRSPRISREWAQQMIDDWGRDNDWVRVNVLGLFPRTASNKLFGPDDINLAEGRDVDLRQLVNEPIIYALDVARFGEDSSRLRCRQGRVLYRGHMWRGLDGPTLAQRVAFQIEMDRKERFGGRRPDYIFVDVTGVGSSPYDHLCLLGYKDIAVPVDFGGAADDGERFIDKRAEMWWRASQWTKKQGCLPSGSGELGSQLCGPTFTFKKRGKRTAFILQSKEEMRDLGLESPDDADAFCMTFFLENPVRRDFSIDPALQRIRKQSGYGDRAATEYDPFAQEA